MLSSPTDTGSLDQSHHKSDCSLFHAVLYKHGAWYGDLNLVNYVVLHHLICQYFDYWPQAKDRKT